MTSLESVKKTAKTVKKEVEGKIVSGKNDLKAQAKKIKSEVTGVIKDGVKVAKKPVCGVPVGCFALGGLGVLLLGAFLLGRRK